MNVSGKLVYAAAKVLREGCPHGTDFVVGQPVEMKLADHAIAVDRLDDAEAGIAPTASVRPRPIRPVAGRPVRVAPVLTIPRSRLARSGKSFFCKPEFAVQKLE